MTIFNLAPGEHTIKMSLNGYVDFQALITVSAVGVVSCVSVVNGTCQSKTPPSVVISANEVIGYLKSSVVGSTCIWITEKGGWDKLIVFDIMALVRGHVGEEDIGFDVKSADIMGAIAYYSGNIESGNQLTGCSF